MRAPEDPRAHWDLPAPGGLPTITTLDETTTRVLAPNPSPMALDGTNTYVVGAPGSGVAVIVDPGPADENHLGRVQTVLADRDAECVMILVTHHHVDHAAAAQPWARSFGCRVGAADEAVAGPGGHVLSDGALRVLPDLPIEVLATPGHCSDHLAFLLPDGQALAGDHVLGRGTSVVTHPEGDLGAYLSSLNRLLERAPQALYPGHGPALREHDPSEVLRYYLAHRAFREAQIMALVDVEPRSVRALVEEIYADVDSKLWPAAEMSTRAAVDKLAGEGRVGTGADGRVHSARALTLPIDRWRTP